MSFGEKLRTYRKSLGVSQLDLENEINASTGSISRMESGKVHPTTDTIHRICKALQLTKHQTVKLFEIADHPVSNDEITAALAAVDEHYRVPETLSHLMDDRWYVRAFSPGFQNLLKFTTAEVEQMKGQNVMLLLFDPESPYYRRMDKEMFPVFAEYVLSRKRDDFLDEVKEVWVAEVFEQLHAFDSFRKAWAVVKDTPREYFSNDSRTIFFDIDGKKFRTLYGRETVKACPRFYVVEYSLL